MILALLLCLGCLPVRSEKINEIFVSCIDPAKSSGSNITNYHRQYGISRSENKVYGLSAIDSVIARINNLTPLPTKDFRTIEVNYKICLISNKTIKREVYGGRNGIVMNACVYSSDSILSKLAFNLSGYQETSPFLPAADGKDEVVKIIVRSVSGLLFTTIDVVQEEFDYSFENLCIEKTISDSTQIVKILGYLPTEPIAGQECSIDIRFKIQLITRSGRLIPIYGNHFYMTIGNILYRTPSKLWSFINPEDKIGQNRWLEAAGLFSYDNTARFHYPLIPSFDTPDPLTEKYPQFSPYAHCAGNPLRYVDRDGKEWITSEDKQLSNQLLGELKYQKKILNRQQRRTNRRIRRQAKRKNKSSAKTGNLSDRLKNIKTSISTVTEHIIRLKEMGDTPNQKFTFKYLGQNHDTGSTYFDKNRVIQMEYIDIPNAIHESKHGYDYWIKGAPLRTIDSEVNAYKLQYVCDPRTMPKSLNGSVSNISDIKPKWVKGIVDKNGNLVYKDYE